MPPKKSSSNKKVRAASWYQCEICNVHITVNERNTHEKVCPIEEDVVNGPTGALEYIRNGALYTTGVQKRTFQVDELKDVAQKFQNNFLFMSEGAMRLANFQIGQPVVIRALETPQLPALVRTLWPTPEKFLTTLFVTDEDFTSYWQPLKSQTLKVESLPNGCPTTAKVVDLQLQSEDGKDFNEKQMRSVELILKEELKHLVYTLGSSIQLNFFNKQLKFVVTSWSAFVEENAEEPALERIFQNLSLQQRKSSEERYFTVKTPTSIELERLQSRNADDEDADNVKHLISKKDIGGLDKQLLLVEECMELAMGFRKTPQGVKISRGLLLYGSTGCGKTLICEAMCTAVGQRAPTVKPLIIKINTSELFSKFLGETEKNLAARFEKAFIHYPQPTLMVIEDVQNLCPKLEANDISKRVSLAFLKMLDDLSSRQEAHRTFVLATTSQIDSLNPGIRRCGRFDCEVEIDVPTPKGRCEILRCLLRNMAHELTVDHIEQVAQTTHAFVGADLASLIYDASLRALKSGDRALTIEDVQASLTHVKPSAMREVLIENPNVHWTDIGGQEELKLKLQQAIEWPLLHPDKFKRLGIKPPRGILMFGPPGCSKTMIAKALATESQLNFLSIKGPELFSMWVGESERAVRDVFRKARQVAPSIVFFDEIDAIGGERSDGGSGSGASVKERVLTQLLTELDGVETLENVTIVAATNRPDMIDKALLRPGRIDRIIYVGLPDAGARHEIFKIKLSKMPVAEDVHVAKLVQLTEGYTGAEIQAVCHEAALKALEESFDAQQVAWQQFEYALGLVRPRTSPSLLRLYEEYLKAN